MEDLTASLRETRDALKSQLPDLEALDRHLQLPLRRLGLCQEPQSSSATWFDSSKPAEADMIIRRHLPNLQAALVERVVPTWLLSLKEDPMALAHLEAYFYPALPTAPSPAQLHNARRVALSAYLVLAPLLGSPACPPQSREFVVAALERLALTYPIDSIYWAIWGTQSGGADQGRAELQWEEAIKVLVGLPTKVANAIGSRNQELNVAEEIPSGLISRTYFDRLLVRLEGLLYELGQGSRSDKVNSPIRSLFVKLQRQGLLNPPKPSPPASPTVSFWTPIMPSLLDHLHPSLESFLQPYSPSFLPSLFASLPGPTLSQYCVSLIYHLTHGVVSTVTMEEEATDVKKAAIIFEMIMGKAEVGGEVMDAICSNLVNSRTADAGAEKRARVTVSWVSRGGDQAVKYFVDRVFSIWTDAKYIKFSLFSRQKDVTHHLMLALSRITKYDQFLISLSRRSQFLLSLSNYLSHPDPSVRRLGMLVAETVSDMTIEEEEEEHLTLEQVKAAEAAEIEEMTAGLAGDGESVLAPKTSSKKTAKKLKFGSSMWDGEGEGKEEARWLRRELLFAQVDDTCAVTAPWMLGWCQETPLDLQESDPVRAQPSRKAAADKATMDKPAKKPALIQVIGEEDDDPMLGYAPPSPHSSRSASPTQEYLDEIKEDPTLHTGMKDPVKKPVYIQQLVDLLRERDKPEKVERGLADGEKLIRAKRGFGTELDENAEMLATMAVALSESFELPEFEERREGLLIALVACAPKKTAPFLIEQYFDGQFSLHQRAVILSALALGGREAAGLPNPKPQIAPRIDFPSKALPPALHRKFISAADVPAASSSPLLDAASDSLRQLMISKGAKGAEQVPEFARERRLRVGNAKKIVEMDSSNEVDVLRPLHQPLHQPVIPFKDVAAEYFLLPLINRFWQHFQDASTREIRSVASGGRYRGAGTGMVLSPMALEKYLTTVGLLMHAARHSSVFLSVLCPEALDLAATIGTRHLARPDDNPTGPGPAEDTEGSKLEAGVVGAALELALITLDSAQDLDGGRTLALDKGSVVMAVGEWASSVFAIEERGGEVAAGAGGLREGRVRKAAAGVVVRVSEMLEKWRGRMGVGM